MNIALQPTPLPADCRERTVMAAKLAALSHPARIAILQQLSGVEACCCKDVVAHLELAQSTVSQHLKVLVEAELVRLTSETRRSRYELDREAIAALAGAVGGLLIACSTATPAD